MRYGLVSFLGIFILAGCGSSGSSVTSSIDSAGENIIADEIETIAEENISASESLDANTTLREPTEESTIDYTQISCADDLSDVVTLINEYRAQAQVCGDISYPAVGELTLNSQLTLAAEAHSSNMANYDFFSHTGLDNSTVSTRVTAQGYSWSFVAENLAAGYFSAQTTVDALMESEGHCKNIMSASATEIGLACSINSDATYTTYWTQVFAKPRN